MTWATETGTTTSGFTPTGEQTDALELFTDRNDMVIEAGAGTGKTTTLKILGGSRPKRMQYVAFNRAIVDDAYRSMPSNVSCNTAHSLAFRATATDFAHRLSTRMHARQVAKHLGLTPMTVDYGGAHRELTPAQLATVVQRSIEVFCSTAAPDPSVTHVPYIDGIDTVGADGQRDWLNNFAVRDHIAPALRRAWADLTNPNGVLPYRHNHYLKAWQLSEPRLAADVVLVDEAQDCNPVLQAIVLGQTHAQLVWVGDSAQEIYGWAGAVNALAALPADARTYLTMSWRFGDGIAVLANEILATLPTTLRLTGNPAVDSTTLFDRAGGYPDAILTRTNAQAIRELLLALQAGRRPALVGGANDFRSFAVAAADLKAGKRPSHPDLVMFETWGDVQDYVADDAYGSELKLFVALIDEFNVDVILDALDRACDERSADLIISTAHKAKGREWPQVRLAGDFNHFKTDDAEQRLLYVAATRAKLCLDISAVDLEARGMAGAP